MVFTARLLSLCVFYSLLPQLLWVFGGWDRRSNPVVEFLCRETLCNKLSFDLGFSYGLVQGFLYSNIEHMALTWAGILEQSMGARNRVGIWLSYRTASGYIGWRNRCSLESIPGLLKSLKIPSPSSSRCSYYCTCISSYGQWVSGSFLLTNSNQSSGLWIFLYTEVNETE